MNYTFILSSDINLPVKIKVNLLQGKTSCFEGLTVCEDDTIIAAEPLVECCVTCQLWLDGAPLGLPLSSSFDTNSTSTNTYWWNEWLTLPVKYKDLIESSQLVFTIWNVNGSKPIGGTSIHLFNENGALRYGLHKLYVWRDVPGDGSLVSLTPHKIHEDQGIDKVEKLLRKYHHNEIPHVKWVDKLTLRRIEKMVQEQPANDEMHLFIEFPNFKQPVVYDQRPCNLAQLSTKRRTFFDPEMERENPIETKFHKLERSMRGLVAREMRPNVAQKQRISELVHSPKKQLAAADKALLWKFRYSLTGDKSALTKFLRCVDWNDVEETNQALELLKEWVSIDIVDGLELLSGSFVVEGVRNHAIATLHRADDDELQFYLLQLVQALRYDKNYPSKLSAFLIKRCSNCFELANFFYWYVTVEKADHQIGHLYSTILNDFMAAVTQKRQEWATMLKEQEWLINELVALNNEIKSVGKRRVAKYIERLQELIAPSGKFHHLCSFKSPIVMPLRPDIKVLGIVGDETSMFTSKLAPLSLVFRAVSNAKPNETFKFKVIFKIGDDLRQDQLILGLISLMDKLLKKLNLDLRLTPYRVLAFNTQMGFIELVPSSYNLSKILETYENDLRKFFQQYNPKPAQMQNVLDSFVKSCAGYCVITYLLGVGDRHLDNLLLTEQGHLFHIDFGYILGRDPKPLPPPMKLCKEMVEAMGGSDSPSYHSFESYCCQSFNILRKSANLILNLFNLMVDANIPDLEGDPEKILLKVQEKFGLELSDQEAEQFFLGLISESVSALFPVMIEKIHKWATYWR